MTKINKVMIKRTVGNTVTLVESNCYEVAINEIESAFRNKIDGKDEKTMRDELIKNSRW